MRHASLEEKCSILRMHHCYQQTLIGKASETHKKERAVNKRKFRAGNGVVRVLLRGDLPAV